MGRERLSGEAGRLRRLSAEPRGCVCIKGRRRTRLSGVRYVITLDTDVFARGCGAGVDRHDGASAAPAGVRRGWGGARRLWSAAQPPGERSSMESARRSRLASLYSGQPAGPHTRRRCRMYQDLFGQASYAGKGSSGRFTPGLAGVGFRITLS